LSAANGSFVPDSVMLVHHLHDRFTSNFRSITLCWHGWKAGSGPFFSESAYRRQYDTVFALRAPQLSY